MIDRKLSLRFKPWARQCKLARVQVSLFFFREPFAAAGCLFLAASSYCALFFLSVVHQAEGGTPKGVMNQTALNLIARRTQDDSLEPNRFATSRSPRDTKS